MASSIIKQLPELVKEKVITPDIAKDIEHYYVTKQRDNGTNPLAIFGSIGGILTGLGIILLFAHNWDNFSRPVKTSIALLPLILFQISTGYALVKKKSQVFKEISGILLCFSVGASIALVAQIYNIPGDIGSYLFTWTLLCIPLVYLLQSNTIAVLSLILSTYYATQTGYAIHHSGSPWFYLLFITALLPYYLNLLKVKPNHNATNVFNWLLPLSFIIAFGAFIDGVQQLIIILYGLLLCIIYNIGMLPVFRRRWFLNGYSQLGALGITTLLIISSFRLVWRFDIAQSPEEPVYYILALALSAISVGLSYIAHKNGEKLTVFNLAALIFLLIYFGYLIDYNIAFWLSNLAVLAVGVGCIQRGINTIDFKILNFGLVTITVLILCRFFDTQISFAVRGLLFLALGVSFFIGNYFLAKKKKETLNITNHEN